MSKMSEEKISDVVNAREFYKGAYAALDKVLELLGEYEDNGMLHDLELRIVSFQDGVLNAYLEVASSDWLRLLRGE